MFKIATITGDVNQPSSRFRVRQYIKILENNNIKVDDYISVYGKYPPRNKIKRILWGIRILTERFFQVLKINIGNYDCVVIQREMISSLHTFERFLTPPRVLDVDDAIYLHRGGRFIAEIARNSEVVICGNSFLARKFENWNQNIYVIPTAVDTDRYYPLTRKQFSNEKIVIGWVGTSGGFKYLYKIEKALSYIIEKFNNINLLIVSDTKPQFKELYNFRYVKWTSENEVENFQEINIGIMPLENDEWTQGKCSYKMLQYMACGSPVVVSPIGMNCEVLGKGEVGFGALDYDKDWIKSLETLINDNELRLRMGIKGRNVVEENYSLQILSQSLVKVLKNTIRNEEIKS